MAYLVIFLVFVLFMLGFIKFREDDLKLLQLPQRPNADMPATLPAQSKRKKNTEKKQNEKVADVQRPKQRYQPETWPGERFQNEPEKTEKNVAAFKKMDDFDQQVLLEQLDRQRQRDDELIRFLQQQNERLAQEELFAMNTQIEQDGFLPAFSSAQPQYRKSKSTDSKYVRNETIGNLYDRRVSRQDRQKQADEFSRQNSKLSALSQSKFDPIGMKRHQFSQDEFYGKRRRKSSNQKQNQPQPVDANAPAFGFENAFINKSDDEISMDISQDSRDFPESATPEIIKKIASVRELRSSEEEAERSSKATSVKFRNSHMILDNLD